MSDAKTCRLCGRDLFRDPLLRYPNMPGVAQHLPDAQTVSQDRGVDLDVYMCAACGLVQLATAPVPYFRDVIRAVGVSREMTEFRERQFGEFVKRHGLEGRRVIEIGSGRGEYLGILARQPVEAYGLEHDDAAVRHAVESGLRASRGFIEDEHYSIPGGPFDAFLIISFFEHLPDPGGVLRGISHNLSAGGVGLVEVPNLDMMLRDRLFSEFMRDHLFYFTERTLRTALETNGFEVLGVEPVWHEYILSAEVRKRRPLDLASFVDARERIRSGIDDFVGRHRRTAIWGAGHQAFAIMAMMKLGGRVEYVVDSAAFKQGKYTPASHIPIVAPEKLGTDPVDGLMIMAGSYSDEIRRIVEERFPGKMAVAILRHDGLVEQP